MKPYNFPQTPQYSMTKKPRILPKPQSYAGKEAKDPVAVFCRIRPPDGPTDEVCAVPLGLPQTGTLKLTPPVTSFAFRNGSAKEHLYKFQMVFPQESSQKAIFNEVAKPLVADLLNGKNGLLFAYGITGSGKTYTMEGTRQDGGIVRRTVDVLFNSIQDVQARKYIFKPDKMNGFDVQSDVDAMLDRQRLEVIPSAPKTPGRMITRQLRKDTSNNSQDSSDNRVPDTSRIAPIDEDSVYSVFVNYIEIYNNYIYDLLEEFSENNMTKNLQSKILREDGKHNMYVHGCTEVEVKTSEEAFQVLARGQKQRKVAHTRLNMESSRSHSVFTIRVVQAPLDANGEEVVTDKAAVTMSQLSLVDLAGSERTNRTKATGDRLKESGNINNSLMALRQCIEILRENQKNITARKVPYRDSKLTHFFKNYFEGEGNVRMVVCVNPKPDDYDETLPVMKFAELASEVQIHRPIPPTPKYNLGLTPGRGRFNRAYKEVEKRLKEEGVLAKETVDISPLFSLGPDWPSMEFSSETFEETVQKLLVFLRKRLAIKEKLATDLEEGVLNFHKKVEETVKENIILRSEVVSLRSSHEEALRKLGYYESQLMNAEAANDSLQLKFTNYNTLMDEYNRACEERDMAKSQGHIEKQRMKSKLKTKLEAEKQKMVDDMNNKLKEQKQQLKNQMYATQVKALQNMFEKEVGTSNSNRSSVDFLAPRATPVKTSRSDPKLNEMGTRPTQKFSRSDPKLNEMENIPTSNLAGPAISNPRHRRSLSQGANVWVEHRPNQVIDPNTVLQPNMQRRKSVTRLRSEDLLENKVSHYCLTTQNQDSAGELETKLYKGDILPTVGGGAQVVFQDVEILHQRDPLDVSFKRNSDGTPRVDAQTLLDRCSKGVIGVTPRSHYSSNKRFKK